MSRFSARHLTAALLAASACTLTACGGGNSEDLARTFGFVRDVPDEFAVTTQPPLSMPPDYALRPPRPGAARPQTVPEARQAEEALAPQLALAPAPTGDSRGQQALVSQAGPPAPAGIRQEVNREAALDQPGQGFTNKLMFWRSPPPPGTVIDPTKEAQRLRTDAALGKSPEVGSTPVIQNKPKGLLEGLF